jgi:hypothetical protein
MECITACSGFRAVPLSPAPRDAIASLMVLLARDNPAYLDDLVSATLELTSSSLPSSQCLGCMVRTHPVCRRLLVVCSRNQLRRPFRRLMIDSG